MMTLQNFIDYENVDPGVGPVERMSRTIELRPFDLLVPKVHFYSFIEHQISLEDSLIQILTEPEEFSLLNLDLNSHFVIDFDYMPEEVFTQYRFDLSQRIIIEKRQVTSLPTLFGDLGGLYEFIATIVITLIARIQAKSFAFD